MPRILVVDDEPADLRLVSHALEKLGHEIHTAETAKNALKVLRKVQPQAAVLDIMLPDGNGLDLLKKIREIDDHLPVILMTSTSDSGTAIRAMKHGALDHLVKPINVVELREVVERALKIRELTEEPIAVNSDAGSVDTHSIIGKCHEMQEVYKSIGIVAGQDVTVLIRGESGTGKELVARALYQYSERVTGPFLAVNCAAIPEALLESELFGHEKGSFTGADKKRIGKFEQSSGGTLFLDEIGDMSPVLQAKVLRVLQEKTFERVGGNDVISSDVRVIAATNRNLEEMVSNGQFRADLYYRLNGFTIHLPRLKERGADLEMLVNHFRRIANRELNKNVREVSADAMDALRGHDWPGNIRELQNVMRQSILKTSGPVLLRDFVPKLSQKQVESAQPSVEEVAAVETEQPPVYELNGRPDHLKGDRSETDSKNGSFVVQPGMTMAEIEKEAIRVALSQADGCRKAAAKSLGMSTRTMQRRVKEYDLD